MRVCASRADIFLSSSPSLLSTRICTFIVSRVCVCVRFHRTAAAFDLFSVGSGRRRHCGDEDGKKYIDFSSLIDFISSLAQLGLAWLGMVGSGSAVRRRRLCQ